MASTEYTLQGVIRTAVTALTYINANSIPVRNWDDQDDTVSFPCVLVRVQPRERISPNYTYYKMMVDIVVCRQRDDDPNGTVLDEIFDAIADYIAALTPAALSVDGIVYGQSQDEMADSRHYRTIGIEVYASIA